MKVLFSRITVMTLTLCAAASAPSHAMASPTDNIRARSAALPVNSPRATGADVVNAPAGPVVREDLATDPNPIPLWGQISANNASYFGEGVTPYRQNSRVSHFTSGAPDNGPFRRFSVEIGDQYGTPPPGGTGDPDASDRTEVGRNNSTIPVGQPGSTFMLFHEGDRYRTSFWMRVPTDFPADTRSDEFQVLMQMKQTAGCTGGATGGTPVLALSAYQGQLIFARAVEVPQKILWSTTAAPLLGGWHHYAFEVVYSTNPAIGQARVAVDGGPYSPLASAYTLKPGCPTSHLRLGLYRDASLTLRAGGDYADFTDIRVERLP
jgi:hypothetical protein